MTSPPGRAFSSLLVITLLALAASPVSGAATFLPLEAAGGALVLTFDYGDASHVAAAGILEARGFRGTFYVISDFLHTGPWYASHLSADDLANLSATGHEIGSRTATNPDLTALDATALENELVRSKGRIQNITGKPVGHLAYPLGATNDVVIAETAKHYLTGRVVTTDPNEFLYPAEAFRVPALMMTQSTRLDGAKAYVDFAASHNTTLVLQFGRIVDSPGAYDWTPSDLAALVDHIASRGVAVKTMSAAFGQAAPIPPLAPTLTATASPTSVNLSWNAPGDGGSPILGYDVYRATGAGAAALLAQLDAATISYADATVVVGQNYAYQVAARSAAGNGSGSNVVELTIRPEGYVPGTIVLTFDDGYISHFDAAALLDAHGFKGTFFIPTRDLARKDPEKMTSAQVVSLAQGGHDIEAHTVNHVDLTTQPDKKLKDELVKAQTTLRKLTGQPINHLAYPLGAYDARVQTAAAQYYQSGRTMQTLLSGGPLAISNPYAVPAMGVQRLTTDLALAQSYVDYAMANDMTMILVFHRIENNADEWDWGPTEFAGLMDYIDSTNIPVKTYAQVMGG